MQTMRPKATKPTPPERFRAAFYDYTHNRAVLASGNLKRPNTLAVEISSAQPLPSDERI